MYQIKCVNRDDNKEYILHDSRSNNLRVIQPKCELELNKTGSLSFKLPPNHVFFDLPFRAKRRTFHYDVHPYNIYNHILHPILI